MEISLRYVTHFIYAEPVWESHNSLRARPSDGDGQTLLDYRVIIDPAVPVYSYQDNWGTHVDTFDIPQPHSELVVTAAARVATTAPPLPMSGPLAGTAEMTYIEDGWRFLQATRHTAWGEDVALAAKEALGASIDVVEIVNSIEDLVRDTIEYRPGATEIGVDINRLWMNRVGVCQDFAHLTIAMLRSVGIASRYVSGYFYASDPTDSRSSETNEIVVATHAWVEVAVPEWGWWAIDPTNASPVGERHVKIGHGRDYDDVTPLRGVYYGESEHQLAAEVTMSTSRIVREAVPEVDVRHLAEQQ
ncbi:MAG TPA: transglutaminase family protein [Acidimicrobiia bacterium]|nr:transglutaminase family protein [Acidimicrobiia bacterium]